MIDKARDVLTATLNTDRVAHHLTTRKVISTEQRPDLLNCTSQYMKAQELIKLMIESKNSSTHKLRMVFMKAGQTGLLKYISEKTPKAEDGNEDDDLRKCYEGRCMMQLQGDCYVVAKYHKDRKYINIRNYHTTEGKTLPTKQGVSLTLSRWQMLKREKDFINNVFKLILAGEQIDEELIHLGGGVYATLNSKYHTVDLRHFWKPENSDKPVTTRRGIALNNFEWQKRCDAITIMTDFIPQLTTAVICEETHNNEMEEQLNCSECYSFPDKTEREEAEEKELPPNQEGNFQIMKAMLMPDYESE